mgnify:CR=1 FL=1
MCGRRTAADLFGDDIDQLAGHHDELRILADGHPAVEVVTFQDASIILDRGCFGFHAAADQLKLVVEEGHGTIPGSGAVLELL